MRKKVLITGGSGTVGKVLCKTLLDLGFEVAILVRKKIQIDGIRVFEWNVNKSYIEEGALAGVDYIINLAGSGIADERWTESRKREILESRTQTILFLTEKLIQSGIRPAAFVSASGSGYYGANTGDVHKQESDLAGNDFLAHVCIAWEDAAKKLSLLGVKTVILRTGVVLSKEGGALSKMVFPAKFGLGAPLGSGKQWVSWIHIQDLCNMYIEAIQNPDWEGAYNAVSPNPITNQDLTKKICEVLNRPQWLFNVPTFALRMVFGEMADVVLGSSYVENHRIRKETNFTYQYAKVESALSNLLI